MMSKTAKHITVYEYSRIKIGDKDATGKPVFEEKHREVLERNSDNYGHVYTLGHKKVEFKSFVGVLQLGDYTFEILPKMDFDRKSNTVIQPNDWRNILVDMLRYTKTLNLTDSDFGNFNHKNNSILELYFEFFLKEVDYLYRRGLIKKYRPQEDNVYALKGKLKFNQHISKNLVHQERFYVEHTTYDTEHTIHRILYKTLKLIKQFNHGGNVRKLTYSLLLNLPEFTEIKVLPATFEKLQLNRKSEHYKKALNIAKMILLKYHPDTQSGKEEVLALVFDMNKLWERFVLKSIEKNCSEIKVSGQYKKEMISRKSNDTGFDISRRLLIPDIYIDYQGKNYILDTKWKNIQSSKDIADADLRQLFAYLKYFDCKKVGFLYPSNTFDKSTEIDYDNYRFRDLELSALHLDAIFLKLKKEEGVPTVKDWSKSIGEKVSRWVGDL